MINNYQINTIHQLLSETRRSLFKRKIHGKSREIPMIDRIRQEIETTRELCTQSTTKNCITAINIFERFINEKRPELKNQPISCLTADHIKHFFAWNIQRGIRENTIACYMRSLRSVINRIIDNGGNLFIGVRTSNVRTAKRSIEVEDVRAIENIKLKKDSTQELARMIFLFCLYASGMPLIDAVFLKKKQLSNGHITYYRHKTHRMVTVLVHSELERLINQLSEDDSPYLLPIIRKDQNCDEKTQYRRFYQKYMRALRSISKIIGTKEHLTSYIPRHTWASLAYEIGNDINPIGQLLGHTNSNTTKTYIREIKTLHTDKVCISVMEYIKGTKSLKKHKLRQHYN